jgi:hypothetical protein
MMKKRGGYGLSFAWERTFVVNPLAHYVVAGLRRHFPFASAKWSVVAEQRRHLPFASAKWSVRREKQVLPATHNDEENKEVGLVHPTPRNTPRQIRRK